MRPRNDPHSGAMAEPPEIGNKHPVAGKEPPLCGPCQGVVRSPDSPNFGKPCQLRALTGQTVCRSHGGKRALAKTNRERMLADIRLEKAAARLNLGQNRPVDPATALLEEVSRTAGVIGWLEAKISALGGDEELIWGVKEEVEGTEQDKWTHSKKSGTGVHVWLELLQKERTHLVKCCSEALRAGLQERQVRLAEAQGVLVAGVIRQILGDLALSEAQWDMVQVVVPKALRALHVTPAGNSKRAIEA